MPARPARAVRKPPGPRFSLACCPKASGPVEPDAAHSPDLSARPWGIAARHPANRPARRVLPDREPEDLEPAYHHTAGLYTIFAYVVSSFYHQLWYLPFISTPPSLGEPCFILEHPSVIFVCEERGRQTTSGSFNSLSGYRECSLIVASGKLFYVLVLNKPSQHGVYRRQSILVFVQFPDFSRYDCVSNFFSDNWIAVFTRIKRPQHCIPPPRLGIGIKFTPSINFL